MDSQVLLVATLGLVAVALYFRKDSTSNPRRLPPPPGPKPDPIVRPVLQAPSNNRSQLTLLPRLSRRSAMLDIYHPRIHGCSLRNGKKPMVRERLFRKGQPPSSHQHCYHPCYTITGDIVHLQALGQHIIVINSYKVASELLGQKLVYADRPAFQMIGELYVFSILLRQGTPIHLVIIL